MMVFQQQNEQPLFRLCPSPRNTISSSSSTSSTDNTNNNNADDNNNNANTVFLEKPKRALTSYNYFFQAQRQKMLAEQKATGKRVGFAGMARTVAAMWKNMDASEKICYEALAAQDKARHAHEMVLWRKAKKANESAASGSSSSSSSSGFYQQPAAPVEVASAPMIFNKPQEQLAQAISMLLSQDTQITSALRKAKTSPSTTATTMTPQMTTTSQPSSSLMNQLATNLPETEFADQKQPAAMVSLEELEEIEAPTTHADMMMVDDDNNNMMQDEMTDLETLKEFSDNFWGSDEEEEAATPVSSQPQQPQQEEEEDLYAPLDLNCIQSNSSSGLVVGDLANTMGHECTDLFVNLFASLNNNNQH